MSHRDYPVHLRPAVDVPQLKVEHLIIGSVHKSRDFGDHEVMGPKLAI